MKFHDLFSSKKPVIGCIHLLPLPGAPLYEGNWQAVFDRALEEAAILQKHGVDALIMENFRDAPFYPDRLPSETIAAMAAVGREVTRASRVPVGINALRNDADSSLSIAVAAGATFIRVNVHLGAMVCDQGVIQGRAHETLRKKAQLKAEVLIFADVDVKHASPLGERDLAVWAHDLEERGRVDALIVSGKRTGGETDGEDLEMVKTNSSLPVLVGSGITAENLGRYYHHGADGFIVGSYFKKGGKGNHFVDEQRVKKFAAAVAKVRTGTRN